MTAPSGGKDLRGGSGSVDKMTGIANTSASGAPVVAGDGARAGTQQSCQREIVEPGSAASPVPAPSPSQPSPPSLANVLSASAGVSEPESKCEGAVEGVGTAAQVCGCAPSQSSEGDLVSDLDKTGEAPVHTTDNGEQSSGNVPTDLWKRMKEAGLIK